MRRRNRVSFVLLLVLLAIYAWRSLPRGGPTASNGPATVAEGNGGLLEAIRAKQRDVWVEGEGEVVFLFRDDTHGDRHQLFLVRITKDDTVKISHNIDLAERIPVSKGDRVRFRGEFIWNAKGGVVHWTHHDPRGRGRGGWIEHRGKRYE